MLRAKHKLNSPGIVSHITQCTTGNELLFLEDSDYVFMLELLKEIAKKYSLNIYAFCLMLNHVHLLLSPTEKNLYDAMRDLFSRYAMRFNRKYERKGHLFGGPYRQAVCFDNSYFLTVSLYIHLLPVKSGWVKTPQDYRWSSATLYCCDDALESFIEPRFILNILSKDHFESKEQYQILLKKGMELKTDNPQESKNPVENLRFKLITLFPSLFSKVDKEKPITTFSGIDLFSFYELKRQLEEIRMDFFTNNIETRRAKKYLIKQLITRGYKRSEIAKSLGLCRKTVYRILNSQI